MRPSVLVLGVPVDDVTMDEAVDDIARFVRDGRAEGRSYQVTTVNLDFVTNAVRDREVMGLLQRAELSIPDGMPIIWGARLLGSPLRTRVTGADLVDALVGRASTEGWTVYLFGAGPGVAEKAARLLLERHPGATVIGDSGPMISADGDMDPVALDRIRAARPDIVCVALGNPKQERWIARHAGQLGIPVAIGVGGTFDFLVGLRRRAPLWMQRAGLEWVYRAIQEPARLGPRYALDAAVCGPRFAAQLWRRRRPRRRGSTEAPWSPATIEQGDGTELRVEAHRCLDVRRDGGLAGLQLGRAECVEIDVGSIDDPDARIVETLVSLARGVAGPARLLGARPALRERLVEAHVVDLFEWSDHRRRSISPRSTGQRADSETPQR